MDTTRTYCDGALTVSTACRPMRISHVVCCPRVVLTATGAVLLDLTGTPWDVSLYRAHDAGGALVLPLREYDEGRREALLVVDPASGRLFVGGRFVEADEVEDALRNALGPRIG